MSGATVADLVAALEHAAPKQWAEPWDRVGLLLGDHRAPLRRALVTLDVTADAVARARELGAGVLLTHHPAWLKAPERLVTPGSGALPLAAAAAGVALVCAHTNLDRAPAGADALPAALGLAPLAPLESSLADVALVVTYVPAAALDGVADAMSSAGAGRIGLYDGCSFVSAGEGRFIPLEGARPAVGEPGIPERAAEERLEMVCAADAVPGVLAAARGAHPYEEPVLLATAGRLDRGAARLGRVCEAASGLTLGDLAALVRRRLGVLPRCWGDPATLVRRVATSGGSGGSLLGLATAAGCDVMVTGEVRYHEAMDALGSGLAIVEAGHDATEWPLVGALARIARAVLPEADVIVDEPRMSWWTPREA